MPAKPESGLLAENERASGLLVKLGVAAFTSGDFGRAARSFRQALELHSSNRIAWLGLARIQRAAGQLGQSLASLETALGISAGGNAPRIPEEAALRALRGMTLRDLGRPAEAVLELDEALRLGFRERDFLRCLADVRWSTGRYDDAVALVPLDPGLAERLLDRLFVLEGRCRCCGSCCRRLHLYWDEEPIRTPETLFDFWKSDPRLARFRPLRAVGRDAFTGLEVAGEKIWEALRSAGYIDAAGMTQEAFVRADPFSLPGLKLPAEDLSRILEIIEKAPIHQDSQGCFRFHCRCLMADNRCSDHANRPRLCRDFPLGRSERVPECGFTRRVDPSIRGMHPLSMIQLTGWRALKNNLCRSYIPFAREVLGLAGAEAPPRLLAALFELLGRCHESLGEDADASACFAQAESLRTGIS